MLKKRKNLIVILCLIIFGILFSYLHYKYPNNSFFDYTLLDIVTGIVISGGIYYFSEMSKMKNSKAIKVDQIIDMYRNKLISLFDQPIDVENNKIEYLHSFKYLNNKLRLLEYMTRDFNCGKEISAIKSDFDKIESYISENIEEKNDYFVKTQERKEKIPNLITNIDNQLGNITIKLWDFGKK